MNRMFASRATACESSAISDVLKITEDPSIISFAGGLPAPEAFPVEAMQAACNRIFSSDPYCALQYSATAGLMALREWIAEYQSKSMGKKISAEQVFIVSGSQQALDLIAKLFINPGDGIIVESPTYVGAIQAFAAYEPEFHSVETDEEGIAIQSISENVIKKSKLMYIQPNFHNPTGRVTSAQRRDDIAGFLDKHENVIVVEDDPYGELWFESAPPKPLFSRSERVIYLGTFSKILSPGLRLGYVIADKKIIKGLEQLKQVTDLHTSTLTQKIALETLTHFPLAEHLAKIRKFYRNKAQFMDACLRRMAGSGTSWNYPLGGMFIWMNLPDTWDSESLLKTAVARKVAFVPGTAFYANDKSYNNLRLSFVTVSEQRMEEGVKILTSIINGV